jgi:hypothetical protein
LAILVGGSDIHHVRRPVQVVMLHSRPMTVELKIKEIMLRSRPVKAELKIKEIGVMLRSKPLTAEVKTKERRSINLFPRRQVEKNRKPQARRKGSVCLSRRHLKQGWSITAQSLIAYR